MRLVIESLVILQPSLPVKGNVSLYSLVVLWIFSFNLPEKMNRSYPSAASKNLKKLFAAFITNLLFSQALLDVISAVAEFLQRYLMVLDDNGIALVKNGRLSWFCFSWKNIYWLENPLFCLCLCIFTSWGIMLTSAWWFRLSLYSNSLPILFSLILFIKIYMVTVALTVN